MKTTFIIFFFLSLSAFARDLGSELAGAYTSVVIHESGHALTTKYFGLKVVAFRPYPSKLSYQTEKGTDQVWVAGYMSHEWSPKPEENAWISAMGSTGALFFALATAPLLPHVYGFGRDTLDRAIFFSTFDMPAYILFDMITGYEIDDWNKVASITKVKLYWYFLAALPLSLLVNAHANYFRQRANENSPTSSFAPLDFAFSFTF